MAAKLKEFSIFNVSIEFGFMNSKIIDQHFCRDALSISRHVGRRAFFCCCLKYFLTCLTSQIDGVAQNLCVFLGSRPNIFESFVTSPMFAVRSCYKSILSIKYDKYYCIFGNKNDFLILKGHSFYTC